MLRWYGEAKPHLERFGAHPAGALFLFALAVLEACVFPMPTEALFVILALAQPRRAAALALIATAGSVLGAGIGYTFGARLFASIGQPLLQSVGLLDDFASLGDLYRGNAWLALLTSGYTPIPFVLYAYAAGANELPPTTFLLAAAIGRAIKYALLAILTLLGGSTLVRLSPRALLLLAIGLALTWWLVRGVLTG